MPIDFYKHAYGVISPARPIPETTWGHFDLFWVHGGRMTMRFGQSGERKLEAGQGVLIYPHTPFRSGEVEGPCRASVQHFRVRRGTELLGLFRRMTSLRRGFEHLLAGAAETADAMIAAAIRLAELPADPRTESLVHDMRVAQLTLFFGELTLRPQSAPARADDRLRALLEALERHPTGEITLEEMAQRVGLSQSHFRAVFKARQGESPAQYRQYLRMREAAHLLRDTDGPIKQIAAQLGFKQLSHFYRRFQAIHGQTPAQYRRQHLQWA